MTIPKDTPAALKAACSHRPRITRNLWWPVIYQEYQVIFVILLCPITTLAFLGKEIEKETADQTRITWLPPISKYLFGSVQAETVLSFLMDKLLFSYWWETDIHTHALNCLCSKNSWSCASLGKYKLATYLCICLKSRLLPPTVWRLPSHRKV